MLIKTLTTIVPKIKTSTLRKKCDVKIRFTDAGTLHVRSSEIIETKEFRGQLSNI